MQAQAGLAALRSALTGLLSARGLATASAEQARIEAESDRERLTRWIVAAATANAVADILD